MKIPLNQEKPEILEPLSGMLPAVLKQLDQWLLWSLIYSLEQKKWTKPPFSAKTLKKCDKTKRSNCVDFKTATEALNENNDTFDGIGFAVFNDDPFVFFDLDNCCNPETGEISLEVKTILTKLQTYTELSPSGTGIRAIAKGKLPTGRRKNGNFEAYDSNAYLTLTGQTLPDYPDKIQSRQSEIEWFHKNYLSNGKPPSSEISSQPINNTKSIPTSEYDQRLKIFQENILSTPKIKVLWDGDSSLWNGDKKIYPSQSEADQALCNYLAQGLGSDPLLIDFAFRKSGLYRQKWDSTRGDSTYGRITIDKAISSIASKPKSGISKHSTSKSKPLDRCTGMTAAELIKTEFKEPKWAIHGLLPEGSAILAGKPKSGKSIAALNMAVGITAGNNLVFGKIDVVSGAVLYLALEDTPRRLKNRLMTMLAAGGTASPDLHLFTEWPHMGADGLKKLEDKIKSIPNLRLVIIDTLAAFRPPKPNNMNIYTYDYDVTSRITNVAHQCDVCILIIHHLRKMKSDDRFDDVSSSFGITGGVDTVALLLREKVKGDATLQIKGRDVEEEEYVMRFDPQYLSWNIEGVAAEIMSNENQQKIFNVIIKSSKPIGPKEIAEKAGIEHNYTRRILGEMLKKRAVVRESRGLYRVPTLFDG